MKTESPSGRMKVQTTTPPQRALCMERISQEAHYRQRMMKYLEHHGVEETANWYHVCRKTIWKWGKRWDGTVESLEEKKAVDPMNAQESKNKANWNLYVRMRKKYGSDLILAYQNACQYGYSRNWATLSELRQKNAHPQKQKRSARTSPINALNTTGKKSKWT